MLVPWVRIPPSPPIPMEESSLTVCLSVSMKQGAVRVRNRPELELSEASLCR